MTPKVVVVGLGPGPVELVTAGTREAIERIEHRFLRTTRHPSASVLPDAPSFDEVYDDEPTFDAVYSRIVDALVDAAAERNLALVRRLADRAGVRARVVDFYEGLAARGRRGAEAAASVLETSGG